MKFGVGLDESDTKGLSCVQQVNAVFSNINTFQTSIAQ
jgi:hypothetical protein